jgi:transposase
VVYEAGPTGFGLARTLLAANITCIVAAPSKVPRPATNGVKTDRLDCLKLAEYGAKGMVKSITIPTEAEEGERNLLRQRSHLINHRREAMQRIKSMLLRCGIPEPATVTNWGKNATAVLLALPLAAGYKETMASMVRELETNTEELRTVKNQLAELIKKNHEADNHYLCSIPGVGNVVAMSFLFELFRLNRFRRADELASYLGLAPTVRRSGDSQGTARLMPVGQQRLRSILVEAAWMWKTKDSYAANLYNKLFSRTGIPQKAICAVARKLAIIMWRLVIEQREYRTVAA